MNRKAKKYSQKPLWFGMIFYVCVCVCVFVGVYGL